MAIEVLEHGVLAARPEQMYGWPGITRAANGDLIAAASERKSHVCPFGREVVMRSSDNGRTWSLPMEVYNSFMDDRDSNLTTLQDGTIILSWFTSNAFERAGWPQSAYVTDKMREELLGTWLIRSYDHGLTWEKTPTRIPVGMHMSPVELSDGSLISIGFERRFFMTEPHDLAVYKSYDRGATWQRTGVIDCPASEAGHPELNENHVIDTGNGQLTALFRKNSDYLRQAFSNDYGLTWSKPEPTGMWGLPAQMLKLSNGDILCVYGHRRTPYSIRGVLSHDNGKTWNIPNTFTIHEWNDQPDMGYPSSMEVGPGEILTIFYCARRDPKKGIQVPGSSPEGILFTRYRFL